MPWSPLWFLSSIGSEAQKLKSLASLSASVRQPDSIANSGEIPLLRNSSRCRSESEAGNVPNGSAIGLILADLLGMD